ncbi:hypothetical protein M3936_03790 [Sutcliffiella horikoshii]|nr:hypothetical protein [Sutcliffiella horikoshii]
MNIKEHLFWCYDIELQRKLKAAGVRYITCAISLKDQKFWLYQKTDELIEIIKK